MADFKDALHRSGSRNDRQLEVLGLRARPELDRGLHAAGVHERQPAEVQDQTFGAPLKGLGYSPRDRWLSGDIPLALQSDRARGANRADGNAKLLWGRRLALRLLISGNSVAVHRA